MTDPSRTYQELLEEISFLKQRIQELEQSDTGRKQAAQQLRQQTDAMEAAIDGIAILDAKGDYVYLNKAHANIYGYDNAEELIGKSWRILYDYEELQRFDHEIMPEFRQEGKWQGESTGNKKDGSAFLQELSLTSLDGGGLICVVRDTTVHKRTEEELQESEGKFRDLSEKSMAGVYLVQGGVFRYVNSMFAQVLGYTIDEMIDKVTAEDVIFPEDWPIVEENLRKRLSGELESLHYEFRIRTKNREIRNAEVYSSRTVYQKKPAVIGTLMDITERHRDEEALLSSMEKLREASSRYKTLIAASNTGAWEYHDDSGYLWCSPEYFSMLGRDIHDFDLTGTRNIEQTWIDMLHPEDRERASRHFAAYLKNPDGMYEQYFRMLHRDGHWIWIWSRGKTLLDKEGKMTGITVGTHIDISMRKQAEEAVRKSEENYRLLFESAGEGILIAHGDRIQFANPALEEILGYPKDIITSRPFTSFIHADDRARVLDRHLRRLKGESVPTDYGFRIVTADGVERWLQIKSNLITWDGVPASLSFVENITDRKQMETRLIQAQKLEAIGTLSGGMAHNFNNILTGIQGYASLMLISMKPDHPNYERLKSIEEQVKSGAELTQQLLGFARGGQYETKSLDINQVISRSATLFGKAKKDVVMHLSLEKGVLLVLADQNQLEQVFLNLFMNADQAMSSGGNIHLETQRVLLSDGEMQPFEVAPGAYVKITVADTGMGMDEKTRERIFEPFFTTKKMSRGTGLGLATVYGIVKGHRGFITVDSEVGRGTTFTIYLPASDREVAKEKTFSSEILTGTETILVVDDEQVVLEVSKEFLESLGYRVYGVGSGQEALAVYLEKQHEIDLVILDMILPGLSGGDTYDRLRVINPGVLVLLSSGYSINGQAQQIMDRGCNGFLQKPFHLEKLSQEIRVILNNNAL
ncbi:MAG: PAS domain S-box protein [Syntrophus sp. (in: bacteria)]